MEALLKTTRGEGESRGEQGRGEVCVMEGKDGECAKVGAKQVVIYTACWGVGRSEEKRRVRAPYRNRGAPNRSGQRTADAMPERATLNRSGAEPLKGEARLPSDRINNFSNHIATTITL